MISNQHSNIQIPQATPEYTTTLQMLCINMEIMTKKLSKLDGIDKLNEKFDKLESEIVNMRKAIDEIKQIQKTQGGILELKENHHHEIANRMTTLGNLNFDVEAENRELKEELLKIQSHSMKYSSIFSGIQKTDMENENTETVLKHFLHTVLNISNKADINFQNVHRLRQRTDGKSRSIIAKFTNLQKGP